jgi:hypothetical protein
VTGAANDSEATVVTTSNSRETAELGGIIGGWLLQMLVFMGVLAFVAYEVVSVVVTSVSLDDTGREVARAARDEYRVGRSIDVATATATATAAVRDARVVDVIEDGNDLIVLLERDAPTLVIHRIGALQDLAKANTSARITWAS